MSRELVIATKARCDLCGDTGVIIATSDERRVNRLLTSFYEWQVGQDDVCLGCIDDAAAEYDAAEADRD